MSRVDMMEIPRMENRKIVRAMPGKQLGEPKMKFEDTFSAATVVMQAFFPAAIRSPTASQS